MPVIRALAGEGEELMEMSLTKPASREGFSSPEMYKSHALRGCSSCPSTFACEILVLPWHRSHLVEEMSLCGSADSEEVRSLAQDFTGRIPV